MGPREAAFDQIALHFAWQRAAASLDTIDGRKLRHTCIRRLLSLYSDEQSVAVVARKRVFDGTDDNGQGSE